MMQLFRKESIKSKSNNKVSHNESAPEKRNKRRKKRKSILFKPGKRAKLMKPSDASDTSEISVSLHEEKTIQSDGKSDFDNDLSNGISDCEEYCNSSINTAISNSSSLLSEFFKDTSDEINDEDNNFIVSDKAVESFKTKNSFSLEEKSDGSNDSIESTLNELIENSQIDEESDSDTTDSGCEIHECDKDYIVILKYSQTLKIFGFCDLKVLHGKINILGYALNNSMEKHSIYSPKGTALLTLKNTSNYCDESRKMKTLVTKLSKHPILKDLEVRRDSSVLMFMKKHDFTLDFIEKHISQWIVPTKTSFPCVEINPKGNWNTINIPEEWSKVVQNATGQSKILICGGKGVGKSTFLRYAVNCLLQKYKFVRVVDLDPGQSEFSAPSTLSVFNIEEPLLGINYTHLKTADRSILSDINIAPDPDKFIECIQELKRKGLYIDNIPTIINTMGFIDDIAFHLISNTVAILQPNQIVYIESTNKKKNFKVEMAKKTLNEYVKLFDPNLKLNFPFEIVNIPSATDENVGWTLQPRQMREMCILSYFGKNMTENCNTLQDYRLPMFEVDLIDVSITDRNNSNVPVEAANANIVGLCCLANEENSIFECFGWGIVRCHNPSARKILLITPVNKDVLEKVTHLVVGCLTLPPSVYMNQEGVVGHIPYVFVSDLTGFAQMSKRTRIPFNSHKK